MNIIVFTKVALPYGWLGNMAPFSVECNGLRFRTSEALFQAMRFRDEKIVREIREQRSPFMAKLTAKKYADKMVVTPRSPEDVKNMETVLGLKLEQHQELRKLLVETGRSLIVEDCSKRANVSGLFWGAAFREGKWVGTNKLGELWMEVRDKVMVT